MFIAINRFKILKGKEQVFEKIWRTRDTLLSNVKGFKQLNLIKSVDQNADQEFTVFASHSIRVSRRTLHTGHSLNHLKKHIKERVSIRTFILGLQSLRALK